MKHTLLEGRTLVKREWERVVFPTWTLGKCEIYDTKGKPLLYKKDIFCKIVMLHSLWLHKMIFVHKKDNGKKVKCLPRDGQGY